MRENTSIKVDTTSNTDMLKLDSIKRPCIIQLTRTTKDYILSGIWQ